jgi:hypothetical protein
VALMACALFRLITDGASTAGVWSRLRKSRSDLSCHQCDTLFAIVGGVTVTLGVTPGPGGAGPPPPVACQSRTQTAFR